MWRFKTNIRILTTLRIDNWILQIYTMEKHVEIVCMKTHICMAVTRLFFKWGKNAIAERRETREKIGRRVWRPPKNASPRLSSTSCSFVDRTSKLSTKHRKDTALDLKKNQTNTTFFFLYVNYRLKIFPLNCTEMIFVKICIFWNLL